MTATLFLGALLLAAPVPLLSADQLARSTPEQLTEEVKRVDEALLAVQPLSVATVFSRSAERGGGFLVVGMLPGLAVGLLLSTSSGIGQNDKLAFALGVPVLVAAGVGLVAFIGSLFEHFLVEGPDRTRERERLNGYRSQVLQRLSPSGT